MSEFKVGDRVRYRATDRVNTPRLEGKEGVIYKSGGCVLFDDGSTVDYIIQDNLERLSPSSPVRQRTVTEIVAGQFNGVTVHPYGQSAVYIEFGGTTKSAAELTAAIKTLTVIRDALAAA